MKLWEKERVLLHNTGVRGRCKTQDLWSSIYVVLRAHEGGAVYTIAPAHDQTRVKTVHRSLVKRLVGIDSPEVTQGDGQLGTSRRLSEEHSGEVDLWVVSEHPLPLLLNQTVGEQPVSTSVSLEPGALTVDTPMWRSEPPLSVGARDIGLRRSKRSTAGHHPNPHNMPRSTLKS